MTKHLNATWKAAVKWALAPMVALAALPALAATSAEDEMARTLRDAVQSGRTVQRSSGDKGTLYVFSDPYCGHCRKLEPELDKLAQDYTVHIVPVTVIGRERSVSAVGTILCAQPEEQRRLWKQVMSGKALSGKACKEGRAAARHNTQMFRRFGVPGTPYLANATGELDPDYVERKAQSIARWLSEPNETKEKEESQPIKDVRAPAPKSERKDLFQPPKDGKDLFQPPKDGKDLFQVPK